MASDTLAELFPSSPLFSYRQPPNLRSKLVSNSTDNPNEQHGTFPCNQSRCQTCQLISSGSEICHNNTKFTIKGQFTCTSAGVVYAIQCAKCSDALYLGETGQSLRQRMNSHRFSVTSGNTGVPIGEQFNLGGHTHQDIKVCILKGNLSDLRKRRTFEVKLINKFKDHKGLLNRDHGFLSLYKT